MHDAIQTTRQTFTVGNNDHGQPTSLMKAIQKAKDIIRCSTVEITGRLVSQQQLRPHNQGSGDGNTLLFTT